jgi:protein-disulfide isomerase
LSDKPENEGPKPLPQAEPAAKPFAQPEIQPGSESTPRDGYAPYVPFEKAVQDPQKSAPFLSRRNLLGWLFVLVGAAVIKEIYSTVPMPTLSSQPIQPAEPITATPLNPGCALVESASAKVTIEEYTDFLCPYCARFSYYADLMKHDFGPNVRVVYRNLPRPAHGPLAETAARAFTAVCLQNPAVGFSYYKELLKHQGLLYTTGEPVLYEAAKKFNIDIDRMKSDMASKTVLDRIDQDKVRAEQSGLILSPSWIIGDQGFNGTPGNYIIMQQAIQDQLNRK